MMLFDSHAHLTDERLADDLPAVLDRADAAGVRRIVCVATTATDSAQSIAVAARFPTVWASVGLQPNTLSQGHPGDWDEIVRLAISPRVVALGETGLDRHWDLTPFAQQQDYFARHLALARRLDLPVIIHCREAETDTVRMLRSEFDAHGPIRGVMHSYTGNAATAAACLAMGLVISFAGMVTYKSAADLRAVARRVPLDRLLVETDCPYLAPVPVRGRRNEPAYLAHTAGCLASELGVTIDVLSEETTRNALALFRLP